jgi:FKBP-type peptidyl-prolyl cis-trans isomerase FklB
MKRLPLILMLTLVLAFVISSCSLNSDDTWNKYEDWRNANDAWLTAQAAKTNADGSKYFTKVVPTWDSQSYVLLHFFNDTTKTQKMLKPLYTSTVDVKYEGRLYNYEEFDSSYSNTTPADSLFRTSVSDVIGGWAIALMDMHIGDSCEVVIPYSIAYGSSGSTSSSTTIDPYSNLHFFIKLVDIPGYYKPIY